MAKTLKKEFPAEDLGGVDLGLSSGVAVEKTSGPGAVRNRRDVAAAKTKVKKVPKMIYLPEAVALAVKRRAFEETMEGRKTTESDVATQAIAKYLDIKIS